MGQNKLKLMGIECPKIPENVLISYNPGEVQRPSAIHCRSAKIIILYHQINAVLMLYDGF